MCVITSAVISAYESVIISLSSVKTVPQYVDPSFIHKLSIDTFFVYKVNVHCTNVNFYRIMTPFGFRFVSYKPRFLSAIISATATPPENVGRLAVWSGW